MARAVLTLIFAECILAASATQGNESASPDSLSIIDREAIETVSSARMFESIYSNPAMTSLRRDNSYSSAGLEWGYRTARDGQPYNPATGCSENHGAFSADTYLKHGNSTLSGFASYTTGKIRSMEWCETSDYEMVYPYIMADEAGGNLNEEIYRFGGGISTNSGRWHYGASLAYKAGLYYRSIDPRPRNVTGLLNLGVGGGIAAGRPIYAIGIRADKYKQTNSIEFMRELGSTKIYHLTGLGTDYARFAGAGVSTYYTGWRYGASADIHPQATRTGLTAHAAISRLALTNIISDLNKLPMASIREMGYQVEAGWKGRIIAAKAYAHVTRRLGDENIFGDAQSGSYPRIASLTLYAHNHVSTGADMAVTVCSSKKWNIKTAAHAAYTHDNQVQASAKARRVVNNLDLGLDGVASYRASVGTLLTARLTYSHRHPLEQMFTPPSTGIQGAIDAAYARFITDSRQLNCIIGSLGFTQALPHSLALHILATASLSTQATVSTVNIAILF